MIEKTSLIIPYLNYKNFEKLNFILNIILNGKCIPNEILLIYSYKKNINISYSLIHKLKKKKIILKKFYKKKMYPGEARNFGIIKSRNNIIGFLDLETVPNKNWLFEGIKSLKVSDVCWGRTVCNALSYRDKIIRASTLGCKKHITIPGTILKKKIFLQSGMFIENVRAGEDGDFISRVNLHNIKCNFSSEKITYNGQINKSFLEILKKWHLNYSHGKKLPHIYKQKNIYYLPISLLAIIISFNWNSFVTEWNESSYKYIPNITKFTLFSFISVYIFIRGLIYPYRKEEKISFLLPFNFLIVGIFTFFLDMTKLYSFSNFFKIKKN
jgi:hypothetical protein